MRRCCLAICAFTLSACLAQPAVAQRIASSAAGQTIGGGGLNGSLGFQFAQSSSQSLTSTTPSLTTMNGYPGSIFSGTIRPFVTGVTPVIGGDAYGNPATHNASTQLFQSHQQSQAIQLQHRMRANQQSKQNKALVAFQRAVRAESDGDLRTARASLKRALSMDQGPLREDILQRMNARGWK